MSLKHLSQIYFLHEGLCHWNTCHMKSYVTGTLVTISYVTGTLVTDTFVTCRVMSPRHLSQAQLHHWKVCHIFTFSKENMWFKKCYAISNTHEFSSVPHDTTAACNKADDCCCQNVILSGFHPSIKKKSQGTDLLVTCHRITYQHSNMFNNAVCIIQCCHSYSPWQQRAEQCCHDTTITQGHTGK
jgi:hypothetical protein